MAKKRYNFIPKNKDDIEYEKMVQHYTRMASESVAKKINHYYLYKVMTRIGDGVITFSVNQHLTLPKAKQFIDRARKLDKESEYWIEVDTIEFFSDTLSHMIKEKQACRK